MEVPKDPIYVDANTADALRRIASVRGLTLEGLLEALALEWRAWQPANPRRPTNGQRNGESRFEAALDRFFAENPETLPPLPAEFSRDDMYDDHD